MIAWKKHLIAKCSTSPLRPLFPPPMQTRFKPLPLTWTTKKEAHGMENMSIPGKILMEPPLPVGSAVLTEPCKTGEDPILTPALRKPSMSENVERETRLRLKK